MSGETETRNNASNKIYIVEMPSSSTEAADSSQNVYMKQSRTHLSPIPEETQVQLENSERKTPLQHHPKLFLREENSIIQQNIISLVDVEI